MEVTESPSQNANVLEDKRKKKEAVPEWPSINHYNPKVPGKHIFDNDWIVEEKIDGSQLSFRLSPEGDVVLFRCKSSKTVWSSNEPFHYTFANSTLGVSSIKHLLNPSYIYCAEAIGKRRHNTIVYERTPKKYVVLYDIEDTTRNKFLTLEEKKKEAERIGLEITPCLFQGKGLQEEGKVMEIIQMMEEGKIVSLLGGKPEGVVIKTYSGNTHKGLKMLKCVRQEFKEANVSAKPLDKVTNEEQLIQAIGQQWNVIPRFRKAVQHLREAGQLKGTKQDIGALVKELDKDLWKEYQDEIVIALTSYYFPKIAEVARAGFVDWYCEELKRETEEKQEQSNVIEYFTVNVNF